MKIRGDLSVDGRVQCVLLAPALSTRAGTISEECSILGFPAITPRDAIERPEGIDVGCLIMTGLDRDTILGGIEAITQSFTEREVAGLHHPVPIDYCIDNTSQRVVNLILGTARLSNQWDGIRT